ncbi:MAG: hypothetical protein LH624_01505 [Cryobacterium sp.]|nr:hypothetical protein [Cryobacterium sp.]
MIVRLFSGLGDGMAALSGIRLLLFDSAGPPVSLVPCVPVGPCAKAHGRAAIFTLCDGLGQAAAFAFSKRSLASTTQNASAAAASVIAVAY